MDFWKIDRRKNEIDYIAGAAVEKWSFRRKRVVFAATGQDIAIGRWTGSSTWANRHWIRDESRPNEIDYYASDLEAGSRGEPVSRLPTVSEPGSARQHCTRVSSEYW